MKQQSHAIKTPKVGLRFVPSEHIQNFVEKEKESTQDITIEALEGKSRAYLFYNHYVLQSRC